MIGTRSRRQWCGSGGILLGAILATACSDVSAPPAPEPPPPVLAPPASRDSIRVLSWTRGALAFPYNLDTKATRTANTLLALDPRGLTAIDPASGRPLWVASFPGAPGDFRTANGVFRLVHGTNFGSVPGEEVFLDAATGRTLWSQRSDQPGGELLDASTTTMLARLGDTALVARGRANGEVRWIRPVTLGACGLIVSSDCLTRVGNAAGVFILLRQLPASAGFQLIKATETGVVTRVNVAEPLGFLVFVVSASVDASGRIVTVVTGTDTFSIDAETGALRWRAAHLVLSNGVSMQRPVVQMTGGVEPLIHYNFLYANNSSGGFSREIVRSALTGRIVRQLLRPSTGLDGLRAVSCGPDGMVVLRAGGQFVYIDTRTGNETAALMLDAETGAPGAFPATFSWVDDYASGHIVFAFGGANGSPKTLLGFQCRP